MKTINITYINGTKDTIINTADVTADLENNLFVFPSTDINHKVIVPRENVRYLHIREEIEDGSDSSL